MALKYVDLTEDEIVDLIDGEAAKRLVRQIMAVYKENDLTYKIKESYHPKNVPATSYRVFFYIKKSKESMILGTGKADDPGFNLQMRIKDRSILNKLDKFSPNVRNAFINGYDCKAPHCSNDGCEYVFEYQGKEYRKCHMLCFNFTFTSVDDEDIESLMTIIRNEILFDKPKRKKAN